MTYFNIYFGDRCRGPSGNLSVPQNEQNYRKERNKDCTWQEVDMTAMFAKMHGFFQTRIVIIFLTILLDLGRGH